MRLPAAVCSLKTLLLDTTQLMTQLLQGLPGQSMVKYINIWIGCDNDGILSWLSRHLTYDPLIWSKLTSLTSTVSVLKDGKKIHLKFYYSFQEMNFKKISSLNNLTGLNDLDSIISSFHQINY